MTALLGVVVLMAATVCAVVWLIDEGDLHE